MEIKQLNTLIAKIGKNSKSLKADIQSALVGCAFFAQRDRNVDPAIRLFQAIGNEGNRKAMSHWLSTYAPIHFKDEKPLLSDKRQKEYAGTAQEFAEELNAAPAWYEFASEGNKAVNVWDGMQQLERLRNQINKLAEKASKEGDTVFAELMNELVAKVNDVEFSTAEVNS